MEEAKHTGIFVMMNRRPKMGTGRVKRYSGLRYSDHLE